MKFEKGKSGNPHGRPKKENSLTMMLEELGNLEDVTYNGEKISRARAMAEKLWARALVENDIQAIKYIYDRIDGKAKETIDMDIDGKLETVTIEVVRRIDEKPDDTSLS
jgi:hypothetical protein